MDRLEQLKNLLVMATADGNLSEHEVRMLTDRCRAWGLSESEFAEAIQFSLSHRGELKIPNRKSERLELLAGLIQVMAADGVLEEVEKRVFATAAAYMEITQDEVNKLIDDLLRKSDRRETGM